MKNVADVMTPNPETIAPDASIRQALAFMRESGFRRLPVVESGRLVGIISERDLRRAMSAPMVVHERGQDDYILDHVQVGTCMTSEVVTLSPQDSLARAAKTLRDRKVGACPVLEQGRLVGILTESDLLEYLARSLETGSLL
jgi:acetoin utilization protein AcuB